ncbi:hypothetical protein BGZ72_001915 [Mortierella alpina]|nr:hypothetical protein BGZ72_001915 [Mortierella alpina]
MCTIATTGKLAGRTSLPVQWFLAPDFQSRIRYETHFRSNHATAKAALRLCPLCDKSFATTSELDLHLNDHEQQQEQDDVSVSESDANTESLQTLRSSLISYTGSIHTAEYFMNMACPIVLTMEDGKKVTVLGVPGIAEQLVGRVVSADVMKLTGEENKAAITLSQALMSHRYGGIVLDQLSSYNQLGGEDCQKRFSEASVVAKLLAGCLIHSGANVALALKVEIYGRSRTDDPHEQPLAFPLLGDYTVESVNHDGATKLMIGTDTWLALVTSCVVLTTGEIIIGPHNTQFRPSKSTTIWVNTSNMARNGLTERHLRSKFHQDTTFHEYAGIYSRFRNPACLPVTLKTLYDHYLMRRSSGIKETAQIFSRVYREKMIPTVLMEIPVENTRISTELQHLQQMVSETRTNSDMPMAISEPISSQLRVLAALLTNTITAFNHSDVRNAVLQRIEVLLAEMQ